MSGEIKKYMVTTALVVASQLLVASMPTFEDDAAMTPEAEQVMVPEQAPAAEPMPTFSDEEQGQAQARPELEEPFTKEAYVEMSPTEPEQMDVTSDYAQAEQPQDDSGLSGGEVAGIVTGVGLTALTGAAVSKIAYDRSKKTVPATEAPRTQIPTPPVGDQYKRQTPPPPVAPRVRPQDMMERLKRQGAVNVSPINAESVPTRPTVPPKPAYMQPRVNVEPQDRVIKGFDPEKTAKAPLSGAEKITVHKTVPGSQPAEQKRSTFGSFMRGRR